MIKFFQLTFLTFFCFSCSTLLNADFENLDTAQVPPKALPGPPEGDLLSWQGVSAENQLEIVALPAGSQQALKLQGSEEAKLVFQSIAPAPKSNGYQFSFQLFTSTDLTAPLIIRPTSNTASPATVVRLHEGTVEVLVTKDEKNSFTELGGFTEEEWQTFIFNVDKSAGTYTLNVIRNDRPELRIEDQPLTAIDAFLNPDHLQLRFELKAQDDPESYIRLDDVLIYQSKD